jgi:glycerol-3-phosphate dehydrogenase
MAQSISPRILPAEADVVVIGGGVVGAAILRELTKYRLSAVLIEKAPDVATGTSKANSGILHAGFDAEPGSWKARLNVRGSRLYKDIAEGLGIARREIGSLVVAKTDEQLQELERLLARGAINGVPGLELWSADETLAFETGVARDIKGALWAPSAAVACPFLATTGFADNAVRNGAKVVTECAITGFVMQDGALQAVDTTKGRIATRFAINAAGVHSGQVARLANDDSFSIRPRKGEYVLLDKSVGHLVRTVLFPTPDKVSKGILVSPTVHGNVFIGPNSFAVEDPEDHETTRDGLSAIIAGARLIVPDVPVQAAITEFSGLRADGGKDFILGPSPALKGLFHAAGIQSPGLTAAPAIAEALAQMLGEAGLALTANAKFNPENPRRAHFSELEPNEQAALIAANPLNGRVICRCETVTEAEIVAAIHAPCGARTVDGVKRRVRAGSGRCQGGFCGPRVTAILARELGIPITEVRKDSNESYLFYPRAETIGEENAYV